MTVVIDTSGPVTPAAIAAGAAASLQLDLDLVFVGDEPMIALALEAVSYDAARLMVRHATGGVADAARVLAQTPGGALVTTAPSHQVVAAAANELRQLPGARPALCAVYPTARRRGDRKDPFVLILDVGAAFEASAEDLVTYARMGSAYASRVSRNENPRVAVLAREIAGTLGPPAAVEALHRIENDGSVLCVGPVGGLEVCYGKADVIVTSGFLGDMVAQLLQGVGEVAEQLAQSAQESSVRWRMAYKIMERELSALKGLTDWKEYGGAPLLGYDKPVLVADPMAGPEAMGRAIKLAAKAVRLDVVGAVAEGLRP
jgi:glycerol-3-phosphate acyltransferase PlsX